MAMDEKMFAPRFLQIAPKGQQLLDIELFWNDATRIRFDHIVKAQLDPLVPIKSTQRLGLGRAGVQDR
jgi:hypothetical protein